MSHCDPTTIFTVPKMLRETNSMFNSLDQTQIDRCLYPSSVRIFF